MIIVDTDNTSHTATIIPRDGTIAELNLKDLSHNKLETITPTSVVDNDYYKEVNFDYTFTEHHTDAVDAISDTGEVLYRGLIYAIQGNIKDYNLNKGVFKQRKTDNEFITID